MPTLPRTSQGHGQIHKWPHTESFKVDSDAANCRGGRSGEDEDPAWDKGIRKTIPRTNQI